MADRRAFWVKAVVQGMGDCCFKSDALPGTDEPDFFMAGSMPAFFLARMTTLLRIISPGPGQPQQQTLVRSGDIWIQSHYLVCWERPGGDLRGALGGLWKDKGELAVATADQMPPEPRR